MVSVLDSGLGGPGLSTGWGGALCSWASSSLHPGVYKCMGTGKFTAGRNLAMD